MEMSFTDRSTNTEHHPVPGAAHRADSSCPRGTHPLVQGEPVTRLISWVAYWKVIHALENKAEKGDERCRGFQL